MNKQQNHQTWMTIIYDNSLNIIDITRWRN